MVWVMLPSCSGVQEARAPGCPPQSNGWSQWVRGWMRASFGSPVGAWQSAFGGCFPHLVVRLNGSPHPSPYASFTYGLGNASFTGGPRLRVHNTEQRSPRPRAQHRAMEHVLPPDPAGPWPVPPTSLGQLARGVLPTRQVHVVPGTHFFSRLRPWGPSLTDSAGGGVGGCWGGRGGGGGSE